MDKFSEADKIGQEKAIKYLYKAFEKCGATLNIEQHFEDKGRIDMFVTATTINNITSKYSIETKDRYMPKDTYDNYFIPLDKYNELMETVNRGYTPLYMNTFDDGAIIWNVCKCRIYDAGDRWLSPTTVEKKKKEKQHKYSVKTDECVWESDETL